MTIERHVIGTKETTFPDTPIAIYGGDDLVEATHIRLVDGGAYLIAVEDGCIPVRERINLEQYGIPLSKHEGKTCDLVVTREVLAITHKKAGLNYG